MKYLTGTVLNFAELINVLAFECQKIGWAWSAPFLSKGGAFINVSLSTLNFVDAGITIQGGTGLAAGALTNPSVTMPRLGRAGNVANFPAITWPATYHLHLSTEPDEVYLVLNYNEHYHAWLAFGVSDVASIKGTGLWLAGNAGSAASGGVWMGTGGGVGYQNGAYTTTGFMTMYGNSSYKQYSQAAIHLDMDGMGWHEIGEYSYSLGTVCASYDIGSLIGLSPNKWNQEAVLLPVNVLACRPEKKKSLVLKPKHSRYIRVDNYEPGDIITLGTDKWKVYPFYFKNAAARDGVSGGNHSGTFGWAIRMGS